MFELTFYEKNRESNKNVFMVSDLSKKRISSIKELEKLENRREIRLKKLNPVICSWCGVVVSWSTIKNSHGICPSCAVDLREDYLKSKKTS